MPGIVKRRKSAVAPVTKIGLSNYAKISKAAATLQVVLEKNHLVDSRILTPTKENLNTARKRRLSVDEEEERVVVDNKRLKAQPTQRVLAISSTPKRKASAQAAQCVVVSPSKHATDLFDRLRISTNLQNVESSPLSSSFETSTSDVRQEEMPTELLDLLDMHAACLTTLSIQYAHNGINAIIDLRLLCPSITQSWGKRQVHVEDIQRLIGVLNYGSFKAEKRFFSLSDYGHGKICVELENSIRNKVLSPINAHLLNEKFRQNLSTLWNNRQQDKTAQAFISSLPREQILINTSFTQISPLYAKGQQRLAAFKSELAAKQDAKIQKIEEKKTGPPAKLSLLDRLRAKQIEQLSASLGMSKEQIARRSALGRVEEVVAVLTMMSSSGNAGQSRVSFTIGTIVAKLKDSCRTPISKEEAEACLRVFAAEVAPQWVKIVQMGKVEALVVHREMRLAKEEVSRKVEELRRG